MTAYLAALTIALAAQAADGRYADAPAAEQAFAGEAAPADADGADSAAADSAAPSGEDAESSTTLPPETPPPTLPEEPSMTADEATQASAVGEALDSGNLFEGSPDSAAPMPAGSPPAEPTLAESAAPPDATAATPSNTPPAEERSALEPADEDAPKPSDLMRALLATPATNQLAGVPMTLGAALRDAASRLDQTARAKAYWDLSAAVAQYYLALQERSELAALRDGINAPSPAWEPAADDAETRVAYTRGAVIAAQRRLHALLGAAAGPSLPLPADAPHCGRYNTRFSEIFVNRQDDEAAQINELLPLLHSQLATLTRQVAEAHEWLAYVSQHRDPANDGAGVLRSYQLMTERRRAFIDAARDYNQQIAAYAERATPDAVGPDRLVAMLIRTSYPSGQADDGVSPASATSDAQSPDYVDQASTNSRASGPLRTFARRPFDRLLDRERSIVTARRKVFRPLRGLLD
jgi:hypothetical protein